MTASALRESSLVFLCAFLAACALASDRLVYDQQSVTIGTQYDPTVIQSSPTGWNSHPAQLTSEQIRLLLGSLQVSGWSGSIAGIFVTPTPIPVFSESELQLIAAPVARAFTQAGPEERVFFSLPNPKTKYSDDRTMGSLAIRGPYLHFVLTDHAAFLRGDTAGGEERDPRDTKGMKLFVKSPAKPAGLAGSEEPHWGLFEKVHISIVIDEVLALRQALNPPVQNAIPKTSAPASSQQGESDDLHLQIRELTTSNLELRKRLEEQSSQMTDLKNEVLKLQQELKKTKTKPLRKSPSQ